MEQQKHLNQSAKIHLVLLHGWGMNSGIFSDFVDALRTEQIQLAATKNTELRISALDLPGYGENKQLSHQGLPELAEQVHSLLPQNCVLLGWSLGALVAQYLAIAHSPKLIGLISMCSSPKFVETEDWPGLAPKILNRFQEQLAKDHAGTLKRFIAIQNLGQANAKTKVHEMLNSIQAKPMADIRTLKQGLEILKQTDLRQQLHAINVPCLRLYGRLDSIVPNKAASAIQSLHPQSRTRIYAKASHAPFLSHSNEVIGDIKAFLADL